MPVVIDQAPELLKTFERRRAASRAEVPSDSSAALTSVNERLDAQYDLLKAQSEIIVQLQATLTAMNRSLQRAWIAIGALALLSGACLIGLMLRA
jgi:hypothetical protein